jgi:ectoine utilization protein EutC
MDIQIYKEKEIKNLVPLSLEALDAIAEGFIKLSAGEATIPPIMQIIIPENDGEVDVKSACIKGLSHFAIKVAGGFYNSPRLGLPSSVGMMLLINSQTGFSESILLDNGSLTNLRTAIAGAIAARSLAKPEIQTVGVFGSGTQARYQVRALKLVRSFKKVIVFGIDDSETKKFVNEMSRELNVEVTAASDPAEAVIHSDLVITCTPSHTPFLQDKWLHPGLHITAMGADSAEKQELFTEVAARAQIVACDYRKQSLHLGELHHALNANLINESQVVELGEILSGKHPGRQTNDQITLCDLTGVGVQDTQIALYATKKLQQANAGFVLEN